MVEGRFSKWFLSVKKGVLNLFLSISMAYNVIHAKKLSDRTTVRSDNCQCGQLSDNWILLD